ncbi:hypothetical protein PTKIN_Ptkin05aG0112800 [Pterospermum kingtungense]
MADDQEEKLNNITIDDDEEDDEVSIDEKWVDDNCDKSIRLQMANKEVQHSLDACLGRMVLKVLLVDLIKVFHPVPLWCPLNRILSEKFHYAAKDANRGGRGGGDGRVPYQSYEGNGSEACRAWKLDGINSKVDKVVGIKEKEDIIIKIMELTRAGIASRVSVKRLALSLSKGKIRPDLIPCNQGSALKLATESLANGPNADVDDQDRKNDPFKLEKVIKRLNKPNVSLGGLSDGKRMNFDGACLVDVPIGNFLIGSNPTKGPGRWKRKMVTGKAINNSAKSLVGHHKRTSGDEDTRFSSKRVKDVEGTQ